MTQKEKAKELMLKYYNLITMSTVSFSKQCALIAVDEIIQSGKDVDEFCDSYWQEVKKEIEKL